jgi:DNA/RNA endonuclease YhcR with UshA esterase domain
MEPKNSIASDRDMRDDRFRTTLPGITWRYSGRKEFYMERFCIRTLILTLSALIVCFSINAISQTKIPRYSTKEAKNHVGRYATVKGTVNDVHVSKTGTVFFDMDGKYPKHLFTAVIFKSDVPKFPEVNEYKDLTLEITGFIKIYQGKPEIILKSPKQIRIIQSE